ncbi:hypothetical protein U9M48_029721 [Paspalum notatum var. saurae]|uniref:Uncharacterized protein n=1 Tax=Paspalum notatum var. saurae TaxID=547442 RepID=A0AAQ3U256_PASNO
MPRLAPPATSSSRGCPASVDHPLPVVGSFSRSWPRRPRPAPSSRSAPSFVAGSSAAADTSSRAGIASAAQSGASARGWAPRHGRSRG